MRPRRPPRLRLLATLPLPLPPRDISVTGASEGMLLRAVTNAVLALYGEPEPHASAGLDEIVALLDELAEQQRQAGGGA